MAISATAAVRAWTVPDETLHYEVRFKWGFINANAGIAELKTVTDPASRTFTATLTGKSVDLMGHYYEAGDTIRGTLMADKVQSSASCLSLHFCLHRCCACCWAHTPNPLSERG